MSSKKHFMVRRGVSLLLQFLVKRGRYSGFSITEIYAAVIPRLSSWSKIIPIIDPLAVPALFMELAS